MYKCTLARCTRHPNLGMDFFQVLSFHSLDYASFYFSFPEVLLAVASSCCALTILDTYKNIARRQGTRNKFFIVRSISSYPTVPSGNLVGSMDSPNHQKPIDCSSVVKRLWTDRQSSYACVTSLLLAKDDQPSDAQDDPFTKEFFGSANDRDGAVDGFPTEDFFRAIRLREQRYADKTDKEIWDALSSRAGFARVSKQLSEAVRNRNEAKEQLKRAIRSEFSDIDDDGGGSLVSEESVSEDSVDVSQTATEEGTFGAASGDDLVGVLEQLEVSLRLQREEMTPTDVIEAVLDKLKGGGVAVSEKTPSFNERIEALMGFMSDSSAFGSVRDPSLFEEYMKGSLSYSVLLNWDAKDIKKLDLSTDGARAYQIVRLRDARNGVWHRVKFSLSRRGDKKSWHVDTILVQAKSG